MTLTKRPTATHLLPTYASQPIAFERGAGAWLWDEQGNRYLDALSGIAVCGIGHAHPEVTATITAQAEKLLHTSNIFTIPNQIQLASNLCRLTGMDQVFFANSGAEANEAAIKLVRLFARRKHIKAPAIIVAENSFHGRTLATLSATGNRNVQAGFEPLVGGFIRVPYNDIESIQTVAKNNKNVVAVWVEPIQGEGGVNVPDEGYLQQLRAITNQNDWLLMLDEIQTGIARTGKFCAFQHEDLMPDILTLAKGLGNGIPIGACLVANQMIDGFQPGQHGSTFGGNPFVTAVSNKVLEIIERDELAVRAQTLGDQISRELKEQLQDLAIFSKLAHKGMMFGVHLNKPCAEIVPMALAQGLIVNVTSATTVRLLPPLTMSDEEAQQMIDIVVKVIKQFAQNS